MKDKQLKSIKLITQDTIKDKIIFIKGQKVMLDKDLAELYGVETRYLTRQVRRNIERFPEDFLLNLTQKEFENLKCHFGTSRWGGTRKLPLAFTQKGVAMLSGILNSKRAIQVNIQIMRTFTRLRELMLEHKDLRVKIEKLEKKYDYQFEVVFEAIKKLVKPLKKPKTPIGFHAKPK